MRKRGIFEGLIPSIIIMTVSVGVLVAMREYIIPHYKLQWMFPRSAEPSVAPVVPVPMAMPQPKTPLAYAVALFIGLSALGGAFAVVAVALAGVVSRSVRNWIERQIGWMAIRPLPAIHLLDVIAIFMLYACLQLLDTILLHALFNMRSPDMIKPALMLASDMAMAGAICGAMLIACWRARGWHGTRGFWTAWSNDYVSPKRSIWQDILLGVLCYPLTLWIAQLVAYEGKFLVHSPDRHFIILEFARHPRPIVAAVYVITGTLGAAFFEETVFRGMLYNSLRRFLGGPFAALVAAFIFAYMHGLKSDLMPLFVLGLMMTWLYDKTGRLVAGMTFHFTNNMVSMVMTLILYNQ